MTRYNGSSSPEVLSWTLDGNQVSDSDEYFYDPAGNLLTIIPDPEYPLEARYNILNLPKRFFQNESDTDVALSYLYDVTKAAAIDAEGKGYRYAGPFRFLQTASGALVLESAASAGGRIVNVNVNPDGSVSSTTPDLQVRYFITDHLGSVRLVADAAGNVLERNDFLPFGEKCQNNGLVSAENPYLYGGKELQTFFGIDWYDSGARFQTTHGTFSSLDPMAESYFNISPYAYCAGDPVNYVDPEGLAVYRDTEGNVLYRNELEEEGGNKYVDGSGRVWWRQEGSVSGAVGKYRYTFNPHGVYLSPAYTTATYLQESEETDEAFNQRMRSLAASIHGTALGVMGHQVYQPGVKWLGKNLKWYDFSFNGNQYTGGRNAFARSLSKGLKVGGFIWNGLSIWLELSQIKQSSDTREQINHFINAGMGMIGFASGYGPFISVGWSLFGDDYYNSILDYYITPQIESGGLYEPLVSY